MPRSRQRRGGRRAIEASRRATVETRPLERDDAATARPAPSRSASRAGRSLRGSARATGAPSASLEKAAAAERTYVVKDFRRIGATMAAMLVLLVLAGMVENAVLR